MPRTAAICYPSTRFFLIRLYAGVLEQQAHLIICRLIVDLRFCCWKRLVLETSLRLCVVPSNMNCIILPRRSTHRSVAVATHGHLEFRSVVLMLYLGNSTAVWYWRSTWKISHDTRCSDLAKDLEVKFQVLWGHFQVPCVIHFASLVPVCLMADPFQILICGSHLRDTFVQSWISGNLLPSVCCWGSVASRLRRGPSNNLNNIVGVIELFGVTLLLRMIISEFCVVDEKRSKWLMWLFRDGCDICAALVSSFPMSWSQIGDMHAVLPSERCN